MSNLILLQRDSYLEFVKPGVKQDTMNLLRNAPMFGYRLFPDAAIMTAEQDIQKHKASSVTQEPGLGASQHTSWKGSHRYRPYNCKDRKPASSEQTSQQEQQPWRQFSRSHSRGRGRGRGSNPHFSKGERSKSRSMSDQNKACQRCFLCKSMSFCPICSQYPQCSHRTECRGKTSTVLAYLARNGCKSSGGLSSEGQLHSSLQTEAPFDKVSLGSKWLREYHQKPVSKRSLGQSHRKVGSRKSGCQVVSGLLQPTLPSSQTKQKMEANLGSKSAKSTLEDQFFQDGNSGDNLVVLTERRMGDLSGFQRCVFPYPNLPEVQKISQIFPEQSNLSVHSSPFWFGHGSPQVHKGDQEVKLMAQGKGIRIHQYLDDWLLRAPCLETCLQHTQTLLALCQQLGWVVNMKKSEL